MVSLSKAWRLIFASASSESTFYLNEPTLNAQIDSGELASYDIKFSVSAFFKNDAFGSFASGSLNFYRSGDDLNYSGSITIRNSDGSSTASFMVNYSSETGFEFYISSSVSIRSGLMGNLKYNLSSIEILFESCQSDFIIEVCDTAEGEYKVIEEGLALVSTAEPYVIDAEGESAQFIRYRRQGGVWGSIFEIVVYAA